jgi:hypothetical protein
LDHWEFRDCRDGVLWDFDVPKANRMTAQDIVRALGSTTR